MTDADLRQRLVAIFAADATGYSRLMATDERGTVADLDAARRIFRSRIEANQGRVIDMAGDSVLAVFETATGAVSAALTIQGELKTLASAIPEDRRMPFRIGIHLGDVIEKADGTIYGDGVNIAARLEGLSEPGGTMISDAVQGAVRGKVRANFADKGEQHVKNIPYAVRAYAVHEEDDSSLEASSLAIGEIDLSLPDKPSIAVLPFANLSSDPEQEYFTDGVTEDIITELSRFHALFVIARNSSFSYKGKSPEVRQVGRELGVRYVLEGGIRRAGQRIRVTAQLIDTASGNQIWTERYDRELADVFAIQEEVSRSIVAAIAPEVRRDEQARAAGKRSLNLSAYDHALRARALLESAAMRADAGIRDQALSEARKALEIDPNSVEALIATAAAIFDHIFYHTSDDPIANWRDAMAAVTRAIEIDSTEAAAHNIRGRLLLYAPDGPQHLEARRSLLRALELNPNDGWNLSQLGFCEAMSGESEVAVRYVRDALRINPRDPRRPGFHATMMVAAFTARDYAGTVHYALQAASERPNMVHIHVFAAQGYVGLGEIDKARAALEKARSVGADFVRVRIEGWSAFLKPGDRRRQMIFLRIAAGLEDPSTAIALR